MAEEYNTYGDGLGLYKITLDNIADIEKVAENFKTLNDRVGNIQSIELDGLGEDVSFQSVEKFIKYMWQKVGNIELTDLKVKITTDGNKTLDVVLNELKAKDTEIINTMNAYKAAVDDYSTNLGVFAGRHKTANDRLEALLGGDI